MTVGYNLLMFGLGLVLLIWGSSLFVDSAVALAKRFHLPEVLIGATIVSLGTTLPEVLFSTMASVNGLPDMALGNALGSILCNTGLIAGLLLVLRPIILDGRSVKNVVSGSFFLGTGFLVYALSGALAGGLTRISGALLLAVCVYFFIRTAKNGQEENGDCGQIQAADQQRFGVTDVVRMILEAGAIYLGASFLVRYGPELARSFGVPEVIISLTFVALGTSLPELVTSLVALKKNHSSLSLGNIIGADILNFLLVGGISAMICPAGYPASIMVLELPFIFLFLALLCLPSAVRKKAGRVQGALLLGGYLLYLALMVGGQM